MAETAPDGRHVGIPVEKESTREKDSTDSFAGFQDPDFDGSGQRPLESGEDEKVVITEEECEGELGFSFSSTKKWVCTRAFNPITAHVLM
jgi:hypothetical protein